MVDVEELKADERAARMRMVRAHRDPKATVEDMESLVAEHEFQKLKLRIAIALTHGPKLSHNQKREIARML